MNDNSIFDNKYNNYIFRLFYNKDTINREDIIEMVRINGLSLKFIKDEDKDIEICIEAIKSHRNAINYVPKQFKKEIIIHWRILYE